MEGGDNFILTLNKLSILQLVQEPSTNQQKKQNAL